MTAHPPPTPVAPPDPEVISAAIQRLHRLATPPGALGRLGDIAVWASGTQGAVPPPPLDHARLVVFAGDHGVAGHDVSAFPPALTGLITRAALSGGLVVNALAAEQNVSVRVLDIGVDDDFTDLPNHTRQALQEFKVRRSCEPIHLRDAMPPHDLEAALAAGTAVAQEEIDAGAQLLLSGDLGIGNTTPAAALVASGLGLPATEVVGRGTGIDDAMLRHKVSVVQTALDRVGDDTEDPKRALAGLGSPDLAATTGYLLTAARRRVPVLLDGLMSVACALTADRIAPGAARWFAAGHRSTEPAQSLALEKMGLTPILDLDMRVGEGSGAVVAVSVVRSAITVLRDVALLDDLMAG
ncbi:nicotinate-nucleotide--dimethylbenzimidazole phosphoribosyltransferase [Gordonia sp. ABSL11-1]|uniref:nicotinate-nucleotide--dimethylbenzimidazole phosphoribosyltransferase n=1 Tax=Gordonia sp. ABSL11-1 TaxID=3053924 RepID=UPI00257409C9|nr:nicotinate-nucleotide--dimethylbenzimidazole phosphoribosyltransferase [Gordonia sp. ABSL11-1]MDL9948473.1 nicotinate-nucleotide--dimethylbenzimidazole phosphoribosyltransferase [Gordonia sp. ABSL11-1]